MIKLTRPAKPNELTTEEESRLTGEFKNSKAAVWNRDYIKAALLSMSSDKCAYCEVKLNRRGTYMEVEHYHPKDIYEDEVISWENLLPSCKRCNGSKGELDTKLHPIIDPTVDDPKIHLTLNNYRYVHKTDKGKNSKNYLNLNDPEVQKERFEICLKASEVLETMLNLLEEYQSGTKSSTRTQNRITRGIEILLKEAGPDSEYAAVVATTLLTHEIWDILEVNLKQSNMWSTIMEARKAAALNIAYM